MHLQRTERSTAFGHLPESDESSRPGRRYRPLRNPSARPFARPRGSGHARRVNRSDLCCFRAISPTRGRVRRAGGDAVGARVRASRSCSLFVAPFENVSHHLPVRHRTPLAARSFILVTTVASGAAASDQSSATADPHFCAVRSSPEAAAMSLRSAIARTRKAASCT